MGEVYRARDTRLDRSVAIEILPPTLAADAEWRERFEREARAISSLRHPHICALYDLGVAFLGSAQAFSQSTRPVARAGTLKPDASVATTLRASPL